MNIWAATEISIIRASRVGDLVRTGLHLDEGSWPTEALAPATVWRRGDPDERVIDLHRLVSIASDTAMFESYKVAGTVPTAGGPYAFIAWWTPINLGWRKTAGLNGVWNATAVRITNTANTAS